MSAVIPLWREQVRAFRHTLRVLHNWESKHWLLVAMAFDYTAYLDASGTDKGQRSIAFAGALSTGREWLKFTHEWSAVLQRFRLPYFHMTEFVNSKGIFAGWSDDQRGSLLATLAPIISRRTMFAFGGALNSADYEAAVRNTGAEHPAGAAGFCLMACLEQIGRRFENSILPTSERIRVVFDWDDIGRRELQEAIVRSWDTALEKLGLMSRLGPPSFEQKTAALPLQAADVFAHQAFQHQRDDAASTGKVRYTMRYLLDHIDNDFRSLNREMIERILARSKAKS